MLQMRSSHKLNCLLFVVIVWFSFSFLFLLLQDRTCFYRNPQEMLTARKNSCLSSLHPAKVKLQHQQICSNLRRSVAKWGIFNQMCANHISSPVSLWSWLLLDLIQTDCSTAAKTCQMLLTAPCFITTYLTPGIFKNIFLLITSQRSVSPPVFARLTLDSCHDSWHERLEKKPHCPSFSLASITGVRGWEGGEEEQEE